MKVSEFAAQYNIDQTEAVCAVSAVVGKELSLDDEFDLTVDLAKELTDFLGMEIKLPEGAEEKKENNPDKKAEGSDQEDEPQAKSDKKKETKEKTGAKKKTKKQAESSGDKEKPQDSAASEEKSEKSDSEEKQEEKVESKQEEKPVEEEKSEGAADKGDSGSSGALTIKDFANQYELDITEAVCAVSAIVGEELSAEDSFDLTADLAKELTDFLGKEISVSAKDSEEQVKEKEAASEVPAEESKEQQDKEKPQDSAAPKDKGEKSDSEEKQEEKAEDKQEEKPVEEKKEKIEESKEKDDKEAQEQEEKESSEKSEKEDIEISGQEEGSPRQEESAGKQGEEEQEPAGTNEEPEGGEDKDVPEVAGDERAALLGDSPAAPDSSEKNQDSSDQNQDSSGKKADQDEGKILLKEGENIDVEEKVVDIKVGGESPADDKPVPVETVEDVTAKEQYTAPGLSKKVVYGLFGVIGLSLVLLVFGFVKLMTAPKQQETQKPVVSAPMSEAELFAILYKMIDKGQLASAEDFYESIKDKLSPKFLDDAINYIGYAYFKKAQSTSRKEFYEKAIEYYKALYAESDKSSYKQEAILRLAEAYKGAGDVHNSLKFYRDFLQEFAYSKEAQEVQFNIGKLLYDMGNYAQSLLELWKLIGKYPNSKLLPQAYKLIADIYRSQKKYKELSDVCRTFLAKFPKHKFRGEMYLIYGEALSNLGEYGKAVEAFKKGKGLIQDEDMGALLEFELAKALNADNRPKEAIKEYKFLAKKYKYSEYAPKAMLEIARTLAQQDEFEEAIEAYYQFKERFYDSDLVPVGIEEMALLLAREGRFKEAANWLQELVKKYRRYKHIRRVKWKLARTLELMGRYSEAADIYDKLLEELQLPDDAIAMKKIYMAKAEAQLRAKKYRDAVGTYIELIEKFKESKNIDRSKIYYRMSVAYFYAGEYAKAERTLKDAIVFSALSPWRFWCRYLLGRTYEAVGDITPAIENYVRVANNRFLGDYRLKSATFFALGRVYFKAGQYDEALEAFKNASALSHNWHRQTELIKWQADCYVEKKEYDSAFNSYSRYLDRILKKHHCTIEGSRSSTQLLCEENIDKDSFADIMYAITKIADMFFLKGDIKGARNVYSKVEAIYKKAQLPVPDWILYQKALCFKQLGEEEKARAYFEQVKELYPDSYWAKEADWNLNEMAIREKLESTKDLVEELSS